MYFIVGLGNPGRRYKFTLHNLGFLLLDKMAEKYNLTFKKRICSSRVTSFTMEGRQLMLVKPYTYMNLSGKALRCLKDRYGFNESDLLVICDDFNLEKGTIRIKPRGSAGGHKGLMSIIQELNTEEFPRLRIGIGPLDPFCPAEEFVLKEMGREERLEYDKILDKVMEAVEVYIKEGIEKAMSLYNRRRLI
jgi:PTH1 family peptidyl-tRNA hydrolase